MSEEKTKRGRFSQSELDEVKTLHEKGKKPEFIAKKLNRGVDNIKKIIDGFGGSASEEKSSGSKEAKEEKAAKETKATKAAKDSKKEESKSDSGSSKKEAEAAKPVRQPRSSGVEMINHDFWIRKGMLLRLSLPEDLTKAEAESLAAKISNVPFAR